ncbi:MAG: hypothetical protein H0T46_10250 [Deltaproteobacteria bacterium]|nr:hypothetical protein [Deltaproteobacteria bacterium]
MAAASQAAGCIITSDGGDEFAIVTAEWSLKSTTGQTLSCPPGITIAAVYAQEVDANYNRVGAPFVTTYDCTANFGNTQPLPPSVYEMWVELTDSSGNMVYATSTSRNEAAPTERFPDGYFVDVVDVDKTFKTTLLADGGYFQFDWDLRRAGTNAPLTCAEVPKVAILSTSVTNPNNSFDDRFFCDENYGLTGGLLQGTYTLEVSAINTAGQGLGPQTQLLNKQISSPNKVTELGTIMVRVD